MRSLLRTVLPLFLLVCWPFRALFLVASLICFVCAVTLHAGLWQGLVFFCMAWLLTAMIDGMRNAAYRA